MSDSEKLVGDPVTRIKPPVNTDAEPKVYCRVRHGLRIKHLLTKEYAEKDVSPFPVSGPVFI